MNTCDTCKFWRPEGGSSCYGYCQSGKIKYPTTSNPTDDDILCYQTAPLFGPKFGCIHHQPKEQS